jgi:hypothetical protein
MKQIAVLLPLLLAVAVFGETQRIQVDSSEQTAGMGWGQPKQVSTHVILADGSHVALWCQEWARRCEILRHGAYDADVDLKKGLVWIYAQGSSQWDTSWAPVDQGQGKVHKIKYRVSGNW